MDVFPPIAIMYRETRRSTFKSGATAQVACDPHEVGRGQRDMANNEPDVMIHVHKGQTGYGIYFTQKPEGIVVTKLDAGSEAEKAGVQPGDRLVAVMDNNKIEPKDNPGAEIKVDVDNYHVALDMVSSKVRQR